ncbi:Leucine-rich PPR motif-containing, mitochondrial [Gossypium arboreum]|uniref:Leucine-rich PPR motif-containing, mitochondrial n=1 Tax=Gossypium arboreum TaxID=29729 RepID=A0A0B0MTZ5_GOSAR|nr:Leucine-rich PPR motif-containing, mitochondrial [Gossypium arboreum]
MQIHSAFHNLSLFISNHHCHDKVQQVLLALLHENSESHHEFSWDCNHCLLPLAPKEVEYWCCSIGFFSFNSQPLCA